jgi:hypothetical protein
MGTCITLLRVGRDSSVGIATDYSGPDSSVGIVTRYGLDGPGIESGIICSKHTQQHCRKQMVLSKQYDVLLEDGV